MMLDHLAAERTGPVSIAMLQVIDNESTDDTLAITLERAAKHDGGN